MLIFFFHFHFLCFLFILMSLCLLEGPYFDQSRLFHDWIVSRLRHETSSHGCAMRFYVRKLTKMNIMKIKTLQVHLHSAHIYSENEKFRKKNKSNTKNCKKKMLNRLFSEKVEKKKMNKIRQSSTGLFEDQSRSEAASIWPPSCWRDASCPMNPKCCGGPDATLQMSSSVLRCPFVLRHLLPRHNIPPPRKRLVFLSSSYRQLAQLNYWPGERPMLRFDSCYSCDFILPWVYFLDSGH